MVGDLVSLQFDADGRPSVIHPRGAARPAVSPSTEIRAMSGAGNHGNAPAPDEAVLPVETSGPVRRRQLPAGPVFSWGEAAPDRALSAVLAVLVVAGGFGVVLQLWGWFG